MARLPANAKGIGDIKSKDIVKHAGNDILLSTSTQIIKTALIGNYPWVQESDLPAIEQYCRSEARARLINDYINDICEEQGVTCVPGYLWNSATQADLAAMRAASQLGLNPESRFKIAKDAGFAKHLSENNVKNLSEMGKKLRDS